MDACVETKPQQAGTGQDDRVVLAGIELGQAGVDVAAQVQQFQIGAARTQLCLAPQGRRADARASRQRIDRSEEHTSELQSLMRNSYADFCLTKKNTTCPSHL